MKGTKKVAKKEKVSKRQNEEVPVKETQTERGIETRD